jgi:HD superfamily phosphodiesterase
MKLILGELFQYVIAISTKYGIDESHSLGHSMRVFQFANKIAAEEPLYKNHPVLFMEHQPIIHAAAILHDTCDKKYRDEREGLAELGNFLQPMMTDIQVSITIDIINTMSYSKVTKYGMPDLGFYQTAFNVVREADLLDAYDFDRSMIYHMNRSKKPIEDAYTNAHELFQNRVLRHMDDGLLLTQYAIRSHPELSQNAILRMREWKRTLNL